MENLSHDAQGIIENIVEAITQEDKNKSLTRERLFRSIAIVLTHWKFNYEGGK